MNSAIILPNSLCYFLCILNSSLGLLNNFSECSWDCFCPWEWRPDVTVVWGQWPLHVRKNPVEWSRREYPTWAWGKAGDSPRSLRSENHVGLHVKCTLSLPWNNSQVLLGRHNNKFDISVVLELLLATDAYRWENRRGGTNTHILATSLRTRLKHKQL